MGPVRSLLVLNRHVVVDTQASEDVLEGFTRRLAALHHA